MILHYVRTLQLGFKNSKKSLNIFLFKKTFLKGICQTNKYPRATLTRCHAVHNHIISMPDFMEKSFVKIKSSTGTKSAVATFQNKNDAKFVRKF